MSILSTPHDEIMYGSHASSVNLKSILLLEERFYRNSIFRGEFLVLKIYDERDSPKFELL